MLRLCVLAALSLSASVAVSAAPMATSTVVVLPVVGTMTLGIVLATEIPNPAVGNSQSPSADSLASPMNLGRLLPRQIRIDNFDATGNSSLPMLGDSKLLKRNKKKEAEDRRFQALDAPSPAAPAATQAAALTSPMQLSSSAMQELGEGRTGVSYEAHDLLADIFSGAAAQDPATSATAQPSSKKVVNEAPMPVGPGYTTDTMDIPAPAPKAARRGMEPGMLSFIKPLDLASTRGKGHSLMLDTNALLPEPPSPTLESDAIASPTPAWQNMGFLDIDSNRPPPPVDIPTNLTSAAANVSQVPQDISHAPTNITSLA